MIKIQSAVAAVLLIQREQFKRNFWNFVKRGNVDTCWLWTGGKDRDGYGIYNVGQLSVRAHRFSYEMEYGLLFDHLCVLHSCDTPPCVNPHHLFCGTRRDNKNDSVIKRRHGFGEINGRAKLTEMDVVRIRKMLETDRPCDIAPRFGVSDSLIYFIRDRVLWRHLQ